MKLVQPANRLLREYDCEKEPVYDRLQVHACYVHTASSNSTHSTVYLDWERELRSSKFLIASEVGPSHKVSRGTQIPMCIVSRDKHHLAGPFHPRRFVHVGG
jgi:hypothetical protein